jgi:hypothetical protein
VLSCDFIVATFARLEVVGPLSMGVRTYLRFHFAELICVAHVFETQAGIIGRGTIESSRLQKRTVVMVGTKQGRVCICRVSGDGIRTCR